MKQEQKAVMATGVLVAVVLFLAVYLWFKQDDLIAGPQQTMVNVPARTAENQRTQAAEAPTSAPASVGSVSTEIDRQMTAEDEAFDAEVAAETASVDAEIRSINELGESYDESEY